MREVRGTESERIQRERLLDSIYELRSIPVRNDRARVAQLNLERAQLRVADMQAAGSASGRRKHRPACVGLTRM